MSKYIRSAIEQLKQFYIKKINEAGLHKGTLQELNKLTVSELGAMYNQDLPLIIKTNPSKITEN